MAGMAGFEPADEGVKVPCLTPWRHPNIMLKIRGDQLLDRRSICKYGVGNRARTDDLQSHNLAL